jgi:hypothetical protein
VTHFSLSRTARKANKKAAYDMAVKLKKGETLNVDELDSLLLYFAPSLPKKATSAMQWVAKAAAVNEERKYLNYVRVQNGTAYASDGGRMHIAKSDLPEGWYCPLTLASVTPDLRAPDYLRVTKRRADAATTRATLGELTKGIEGKSPYLLHPVLDTAVNENHLLDALNTQADDAAFEYEEYNSSYRIHGSHEFGDFIVMPMRVKP